MHSASIRFVLILSDSSQFVQIRSDSLRFAPIRLDSFRLNPIQSGSFWFISDSFPSLKITHFESQNDSILNLKMTHFWVSERLTLGTLRMSQNRDIFTTAQIMQSSVGKSLSKGGLGDTGLRAHIPLQTLTSFLTEWLRNNYSSRRKRPMRASVIILTVNLRKLP